MKLNISDILTPIPPNSVLQKLRSEGQGRTDRHTHRRRPKFPSLAYQKLGSQAIFASVRQRARKLNFFQQLIPNLGDNAFMFLVSFRR